MPESLTKVFTKVAGLDRQLYLKKRPCFLGFPVNFAKFGRTPFLMEHLWWLPIVLQNRCAYKFSNIHQKISVLKSLFNIVRDLKTRNSNKKDTPTQVFSCEYHKIFKDSCFIKLSWGLLLSMVEELLRISRYLWYLYRIICKREICRHETTT